MAFDWVFSDFESVIPPASRGFDPVKGKWMTVDYTTDTLAGTMVYAHPDTDAPTFTIPLPLKGTYEIIVAVPENLCDKLKIKLASDPAFDRIGYSFRYSFLAIKGQNPENVSAGSILQEVPWRRVTLDGNEKLIIKEAPGHRFAIGFVAARKITQPPKQFKKRYLVHFADDGYPGTWGMPEDDADAIWQIYPYKRMGADLLSHGTDLSGMASYPSKHASLRVPLEGLVDRMSLNTVTTETVLTKFTFRLLAENAAKNRNIPQMVFEKARELGISAMAYSRMIHLPVMAPFNAIPTRLAPAHPEYRCLDISGVPITRLSMAFDEVRSEFLKLFTECVEMGAEGITNVYNRGVPVVLYEQPLLDAYSAKHGGDMRKLPENDPRAQAIRAEFVTRYMREQREAMNKAGKGKKINIAVSMDANGTTCAFYGLDVATWVREGLIDMIMPYPQRANHDTGEEDVDMDFYCSVVKGSPVKLLPYVNTYRDDGNPVTLLKNALRFTTWPIDGLSIWDPFQVVPGWRSTDFVEAVSSLGSAEAMRDCIERLDKPPARHIIRTQQGMRMDKYHFGWGF